MKKQLMLLLVLLLIVVLAACGGDEEDDQEQAVPTEEQQMDEVEITDEEIVDDGTPVVSVNGEEIEGNYYNNIYRQFKTMGQMYGQDISDLDMLQQEVIDILVDQVLIRQDAEEQGIEVTEEEAREEMDQLIEVNGEEAVLAMLEEYDLEEEQFLDQLSDDLIMVKYIDESFDVEVAEEEVEEQFELLKEQSEEVTDEDFEEYESAIRQSVEEEQQNIMLGERIEELRAEADIEILI